MRIAIIKIKKIELSFQPSPNSCFSILGSHMWLSEKIYLFFFFVVEQVWKRHFLLKIFNLAFFGPSLLTALSLFVLRFWFFPSLFSLKSPLKKNASSLMKYSQFISLNLFSPLFLFFFPLLLRSGDFWHLNKIISLKVNALSYASAGNIHAVIPLAIHSYKKSA